MAWHRVLAVGVALAAGAACGGASGTGSGDERTREPQPVLVDYSPTVSDVTALLYLLQHPQVDVVAVTIAGTGEAHCPAALANTAAVLARLDRAGTPMACGDPEPFGPGNTWPAEWRSGADALAGLDAAPYEQRDPGGLDDPVELLLEQARRHDGELIVVTLGPLTNVARAIAADPRLAGRVEMLYAMAGALEVPGNAPGGAAEWNAFIDPAAADAVVRSKLPVTLVPLDATDDVPVTSVWFESLGAQYATTAASIAHALHGDAASFEQGFFFWDEATAAIAVDEAIATIAERRVRVDTEGAVAGRTRLADDGHLVRVVTAVDAARFEAELLRILNGGREPMRATPQERSYFDAVSAAHERWSRALGAQFRTPGAKELEVLVTRAEHAPLSAEDAARARALAAELWRNATEQLDRLHAELAALAAPASLRAEHAALLGALEAIVTGLDARLAEIAALADAESAGALWVANDDLDERDARCRALEAEARRRALPHAFCTMDRDE